MASHGFSFAARCFAFATCIAAASTLGAADSADWRRATPPEGLENAAPFDIDMASATEGWLVGLDVDPTSNTTGLVLHYESSTWMRVALPDISAKWSLYGVDATPAGTWFVGHNALPDLGVPDPFAKVEDPARKQATTTAGVTLFRPSGGEIAQVANPVTIALLAVVGFGADDAWCLSHAALEQLAAGAWTWVPLSAMAEICDVAFPAQDEGWAVGNRWDAGTLQNVGAAMHLTGGPWVADTMPAVTGAWELNGVSFSSATKGWAVGQVEVTTAKQATHFEGLILQYASGAWSTMTPPVVSDEWYLEAVCFPTESEGWAVGTDLANSKGVLLHFTAGAWQNETPALADSTDWALASVSLWNAWHGWAVGYDNANGEFLLFKYKKGPAADINCDAEVNALDVQLVINAALDLDIGSEYDPDVDGTGDTNAIDVQKVINAALGLAS